MLQVCCEEMVIALSKYFLLMDLYNFRVGSKLIAIGESVRTSLTLAIEVKGVLITS